MDRIQSVLQYFQRGESLTTSAPLYRESLVRLFEWLIAADRAADDQTTRTLDLHSTTPAVILSRQAGIVAGLEEVRFLLTQYTHSQVQFYVEDGASIEKDTPILSIIANMGELLPLERTILNVIGRMSGIATRTCDLIGLARQGSALIAGTRKTPWMLLDKKAIYGGGGLTHRLNLNDGVLIKDNHLKSLQHQLSQASLNDAITQAIRRTVASSPDSFEIEVEGADQGWVALAAFESTINGNPRHPTMIVMLDNFDPPSAAAFINEARQKPIAERVLFEASGDITDQSISDWAQTGVDVVSLGALTHSVKNFNVSMALE
jgi:nicotinate-nucleotide pyrophosphorylase (carboxylating)